jgi:hypothetical protein
MPSGLATNAVGRLYDPDNDVIYLADRGNDRILELIYKPSPDGGALSCNRILGQSLVELPLDVAIANYGGSAQSDADLYIITMGQQEIGGELVRININDVLEYRASGIEIPGVPGFSWQYRFPVAVACFPDTIVEQSAIYVTEGASHSMFRLTATTNTDPVFTGTHGLILESNSYRPGGIAFDDYGRIYIANRSRGKIELLGPNMSYWFGTFGEHGQGESQFMFPSNIIIDTYYGYCEMLVLEWYSRQSGLQSFIIANGATEMHPTYGFYADSLISPKSGRDPNLPLAFALHQAYPNPFNSSCKIEFDIPRESHVTLEVFNVLGQRVVTLADEDKEPGSYAVDMGGKGLSSGVYLYRLSAGDFRASKSVVYLK